MVTDTSLSILYQNVRGLRTKTREFYNNVISSNSHIIAVTESWLCEGILDSELSDSQNDIHRHDRGDGRRGGGSLILTSRKLEARRRLEWELDDIECVWITIDSRTLKSTRSLHLATIYLPPDENLGHHVKVFADTLNNIIAYNPDDLFMVCGDFNLPCICWTPAGPTTVKKGSTEVQESARYLLNVTNFLDLQQYNTVSNSCGNTLDLIFSNFNVDVARSLSVLVEEDSFHPSLSVDLTDVIVPPLNVKRSDKYLFSKANYDVVHQLLNSFDWHTILNNIPINDATQIFYNILYDIIDKCIPKLVSHGKDRYPIWYSKSLIRIIKEKNKLHAQWKRYGNPVDYDSFSLLRKRYKDVENDLFTKYIFKTENLIRRNPKYVFNYIKSKRKIKSNYPRIMFYENKNLLNEADISLAFSNFFEKTFQKPLQKYESPSYNYSNSINTLTNITVDRETVHKYLSTLDVTKGAGSDGIPPSFIVQCADILAYPLSILYNKSFKECMVPSIWKQAYIVPIHKKGLKTKIENYRPISILNTFSKVQEKIVYRALYPFVSTDIPQEQHGFTRGRSTLTNLSVFTNEILRSMSDRFQVDVIYTDFEKAFDRVDHVILLQKLFSLGICGDLHRWFKSYITNRSQAVVVGSSKSNFITIDSGVPQGSLLGPLLYSIYIYDLGNCIQNSKFILYADDAKFYKRIHSIEDCLLLQDDLHRLSKYCRENRITINVSKCTHITFSRNRTDYHGIYKLESATIKRVSSVVDLGVTLDQKMTFSAHIDRIRDKSYKALGFVMRVSKEFKNINTIKLLYFCYVRSLLEYCSSVWNPQYVTYVQVLEKIQRKFVRYLNFRTGHRDSKYDTSCAHYKILTLEDRRNLADMMLLHDICSNSINCIQLTSDMLQFNTPSRRTRHTNLFHVPLCGSNYSGNSIRCRLPRQYNKLFSEIDPFSTSRSSFRRAVIEKLASSYE